MPTAADTSPDAHASQLEAYRRMGGTGRAQVMFGLIQMTRDALRRRLPFNAIEQRSALKSPVPSPSEEAGDRVALGGPARILRPSQHRVGLLHRERRSRHHPLQRPR